MAITYDITSDEFFDSQERLEHVLRLLNEEKCNKTAIIREIKHVGKLFDVYHDSESNKNHETDYFHLAHNLSKLINQKENNHGFKYK